MKLACQSSKLLGYEEKLFNVGRINMSNVIYKPSITPIILFTSTWERNIPPSFPTVENGLLPSLKLSLEMAQRHKVQLLHWCLIRYDLDYYIGYSYFCAFKSNDRTP